MAWKENANLIFNFLAGLGAALTAYATLRLLGITRSKTAIQGPSLDDPSYVRNKSGAVPTRVTLAVMPDHKTLWRIKRIDVWPPWKRSISEIASIPKDRMDEYGDVTIKVEPKKWVSSIRYNLPRESIGFFAPADARPFRLLVTLASRADERITKRLATTIRATD